jgi:hypothetical protein
MCTVVVAGTGAMSGLVTRRVQNNADTEAAALSTCKSIIYKEVKLTLI